MTENSKSFNVTSVPYKTVPIDLNLIVKKIHMVSRFTFFILKTHDEK